MSFAHFVVHYFQVYGVSSQKFLFDEKLLGKWLNFILSNATFTNTIPLATSFDFPHELLMYMGIRSL